MKQYIIAEYKNKWQNDIFRTYAEYIDILISNHQYILIDTSGIVNTSITQHIDIKDTDHIIIIENHNEVLPCDIFQDIHSFGLRCYLITDDFHKAKERKRLINYYENYIKIFCTYKIPFLNTYNIDKNKFYHLRHSVKDLEIDLNKNKNYKIVLSGIVGKVYPMRILFRDFVKNKTYKNLLMINHPSPKYLSVNLNSSSSVGDKYIYTLNEYLVGFTCCSEWGYLLKKYFEIPLAGCLLFCDLPLDSLEEIGLKDGINCIIYNKENINDKIKWILDEKNKEIIDKIRENGHKLIKENHTHEKRLHELLTEIKKTNITFQ